MIIDAANTTLLAYAVTTDPDPLQVSPLSGNSSYGALTIVVSNNTSNPIYCQEIQFSFPIGDLAQDLTSVPTGILAAATPSDHWQLTQTADGVFTALPVSPQYEKITADGLVFQIYNIVVNEQVGTFTLTVNETSSLTDSNVQSGIGTFDLAKFPYGFSFGNLAPSSPLVPYHGRVELTWEGSDGPTYIMFAGDEVHNVTETRSWTSCRLTGDTTFLLQASLQQQSETVTAYQSTTVIVADPSLNATDLTVLTTSALQGPVTVGTKAQQASLTVNGASTLGATGTGSLTSASATVTGALQAGSLNVSGSATAGQATVTGDLSVNGTLTGTGSASLNNLTADGLSALSGPVTLLSEGGVLFAGTGISGGFTITTDGFLLAQVVPPSDPTKCSFAIATITVAGISFQVQGGTVGSFGGGWDKVMYFNPNVLTVPVQANAKCYFSVSQSSHNQMSSGVKFSLFALGTGTLGGEQTFRMLSDEELADAPPAPILPDLSAPADGGEEAAAAFVGRLAEALGAGLPDETRADLALLLRRL